MTMRFTQPQWLRQYATGFEGAHTWTIESESEHFAVIKVPGHSFFTGSITPRGYAPVRRQLIPKPGGESRLRFHPNVPDTIHEGRLLKQDLHKIADALREAEEAWSERPVEIPR